MKPYVLLILAAALITSCFAISPARAEVENVRTNCGIFVDNIVEGQPVTLTVQIYPAPPQGEVFSNLSVWMTSPMQGVWGNGGNGPWSKGNIATDADGKATVTFDIVTFSGYWNVGLDFGGQYFANGTIYYEPLHSQRGFSVTPAETPTPKPTEYTTLGPLEISSTGDAGTNVEIFTPQNGSTINNPVELSFRVNTSMLPCSPFGSVGYSLDGGTIYNIRNFTSMTTRTHSYGDDASVYGTIALPKLSEGSHSLTIYYGWQFSGINQRYEVRAYTTVNFFVNSRMPTPTPSPTTSPTQATATNPPELAYPITLASIVLIVLALVVALLLRRKHLVATNPQTNTKFKSSLVKKH